MPGLAEHQSTPSYGPAAQASSYEQNWYALRTSPRHEKRVEQILQEKRFTTFLPLVSEYRQWSDRRRLVSFPLFPGYLFVQIPSVQSIRVSVLRTPGVAGFVGAGGVGTPLPEEQIETVRTVIEKGATVLPYPFLTTGQRVRIVGGSLDSIEGILLAKNRDCSVVISIDLIQNSLAVRVTGYRLVPV